MKKINPNFWQFVKFVLTGILNTGLNFLALNILIFLFGVSKGGYRYSFFVFVSAIIAVLNSYIINKFWVFKAKGNPFGSFVLVSSVGVVINTIISTIVFRLGHVVFPDTSITILANLGALLGIMIVTITNFTGYKLFVFKI